MIRKNVVIVILLLIFSLTGCSLREDVRNHNQNKDYGKGELDNQMQNEDLSNGNGVAESIMPIVLSDLFDGEQRVWFYIDHTDSFDGLAYDNDVKAVIITQDKKIVKYYYNLIGIYNKNMIGSIEFNGSSPFSSSRFLLSDFEGLADEEIIEKVSKLYGDAAETYTFNYGGKDYVYKGESFPYEIQYEGELDSSGNKLKNENFEFFEEGHSITFKFNGSYKVEFLSLDFYFDTLIEPAMIKDKEYVGIMDKEGNMLITISNYITLENITFDSPRGM